MFDTKLKLCVKITGISLRNSRQNHGSVLRSPSIGTDSFKENPYVELLRKRGFARITAGKESEAYAQKKFRVIVPGDIYIRDLKVLIVHQFGRLYLEEDPINVLYLREDRVDCDLDDEYLVSDFFTQDSFVLAICESIGQQNITERQCEIAMPRPFPTPMSTIGGILQREICPTPVDPSIPIDQEKLCHISEKQPKRVKKSKGTINNNNNVEGSNKALIKKKTKTQGVDTAAVPANSRPTKTRNSLTVIDENIIQETLIDKPIQIPKPTDTQSQEIPLPSSHIPLIPEKTTRTVTNMVVERPQISFKKVDHNHLATLIQADTINSSSSGDEYDDDCAIPVVESKTNHPVTIIKPLSPSSNDSESEAGANSAPFPTHRTSLTLLTEELKRSTTSSPQPIQTKALAISKNDRQKRRRNRKKDQSGTINEI